MDSNPVMERMLRLSEQWRSDLINEPDLRMVCWGTSSLSEYRMIKGFVMFHMSEESTLDDIFILCGQPFDSANASCYGKRTGELMNEYVQAWNKDEALIAQGGKIDWAYETKNGETEDILDFVENINSLADYLLPEQSEEETAHLIIAILPSELRDFEIYREWIKGLLSTHISPKVRFMLHDRADTPLLNGLEKKHASIFKYLIPDIDLHGAAYEVLENAKQDRESPKDKEAITFQQHLLCLSDAVAKGKQGKVLEYRKEALQIAKEQQWTHLQAVVHYLTFSLYYAQKEYKAAQAEIDLALSCIKEAMEADRPTHLLSHCQYLAGKAMLFFIRERYEEAAQVYEEGIATATELNDRSLLIGLYQMHGICLRKSDHSKQAWLSFVAGWKLSEDMPEELSSHAMFRYYAMEMLKVNADGDEQLKYKRRFDELWGREWEKQIQAKLKEDQQKYKIFDK